MTPKENYFFIDKIITDLFFLVYCKDTSNKHEVCLYCNKTITEELWCNECDPHYMIDGWTSEVFDVDKFIKDTMYNARNYNYCFLEWVPFERFINIKQIGEGGFSKVYSATWIDDKSGLRPTKVALKKLSGSQNISIEYLNEVIYIYLYKYVFYL